MLFGGEFPCGEWQRKSGLSVCLELVVESWESPKPIFREERGRSGRRYLWTLGASNHSVEFLKGGFKSKVQRFITVTSAKVSKEGHSASLLEIHVCKKSRTQNTESQPKWRKNDQDVCVTFITAVMSVGISQAYHFPLRWIKWKRDMYRMIQLFWQKCSTQLSCKLLFCNAFQLWAPGNQEEEKEDMHAYNLHTTRQEDINPQLSTLWDLFPWGWRR